LAFPTLPTQGERAIARHTNATFPSLSPSSHPMTSAPILQPNTPSRVSKMATNHSVNLNHLLNFTLPPRQTRPLTNIPRRSRKSGTSQGVWNKERMCFSLSLPISSNPSVGFVNAQYRFVMNPSGDYTVHFADPDMHVHFNPGHLAIFILSFYSFFQWHDILQVIIPRSSALASASTIGDSSGQGEGLTTCPICLSPPTAPRMTKCGHVSEIRLSLSKG